MTLMFQFWPFMVLVLVAWAPLNLIIRTLVWRHVGYYLIKLGPGIRTHKSLFYKVSNRGPLRGTGSNPQHSDDELWFRWRPAFPSSGWHNFKMISQLLNEEVKNNNSDNCCIELACAISKSVLEINFASPRAHLHNSVAFHRGNVASRRIIKVNDRG